jgi:hypothetical protein
MLPPDTRRCPRPAAAPRCARLGVHPDVAAEQPEVMAVGAAKCGGIAYNLGTLLRRLVLPLAIQSWSLTSLQQRLFKTGGRLIRHARY